jgi:hypothetical protein
MHGTTVCEDTAIVFDPAMGADVRLRKSMDRLDNTKGYSVDNVRVVSYLANVSRGELPIDLWRQVTPVLFADMSRYFPDRYVSFSIAPLGSTTEERCPSPKRHSPEWSHHIAQAGTS